MRLVDFPNPEIRIPSSLRANKFLSSFKSVINYPENIAPYIFTNVSLIKTHESNQINSYLIIATSQALLRSLYIRNSLIDSFNSRNITGVYISLKAMIETAGYLASILEISEQPVDKAVEELRPYLFGNKGKTRMRIGDIEAPGVTKMIKKANEYFSKMSPDTNAHNFFNEIYDIASPKSHPCYDSHYLVGDFDEDSFSWNAAEHTKYKSEIENNFFEYRAILNIPDIIIFICNDLFDKKEKEFSKVNKNSYFS